MSVKTRGQWKEKRHKENLESFIELGRRIASGQLKLMDIRWDGEEFGHERIVIFVDIPDEGKRGERNENGRN